MNHPVPETAVASALSGVTDLLRDDLNAVDAMLAGQVERGIPVIDEMARLGCLGGGKRLRPILLFLAARAVGHVDENHIRLATAIEMIHAATLVHDDILDNATTRRHAPTINSRWDSHAAVLFGDFLFTHAFYLASTTGDAAACATIGQATNQVCEGELRQMAAAGCFETTIGEYFAIIERKTASLCACATRLGAAFAGGSAVEINEWAAAGTRIGLAFQIIDDVLDFTGDPRRCGKTLGTDFATAKPTLPVLIALSCESAAGRERWQSALRDSCVELGEVRRWLIGTGALDQARNEARRRVDEAAEISRRYDNRAARAFEELGQFLLARRH